LCPAQPGNLRFRGRARRRRRAALRRLDHAPPRAHQLLRPRPRLPLPARPWQLHRGRNLGDPAQHRRRAGARPARRTPRRQGRAMEGSAAMSDEIPDLLYSDAERALSDALASLLADLGCAGLLIPERDGGAGASYREAAAAAEVLGSHLAPVPFLGSAVVATAALLSVGSQGGLLAKMADGGVTAALAVSCAAGPGSGFPASVRV